MTYQFSSITLNALRIMTGFLFWPHGAQKLFAVLGREQPVELFSIFGLAGVLEFFGGLAVMLGLFTRPVSFVLAGLMAVAYWTQHGINAFFPIVNQGELAALYCFVFLFLWANGGGEFSVEGWLQRRQSAGTA